MAMIAALTSGIPPEAAYLVKPSLMTVNAAGKSSFDLINFATFLSVVDLSDDIILLDMACGIGSYTIEIARQIRETDTVHAVDRWEAGITRLRRKAGSLGLDNIHAAVCDVSKKIPLADDTVDICLMATVLHDLIEDGTHPGALKEIARVLKPAGHVICVLACINLHNSMKTGQLRSWQAMPMIISFEKWQVTSKLAIYLQ